MTFMSVDRGTLSNLLAIIPQDPEKKIIWITGMDYAFKIAEDALLKIGKHHEADVVVKAGDASIEALLDSMLNSER